MQEKERGHPEKGAFAPGEGRKKKGGESLLSTLFKKRRKSLCL